MRVRVLGAHGGSSPRHRQTSFLVNGSLCVDAGSLTDALPLEEQALVEAVLVTHAHLDHVASLPFLVENVFGRRGAPLEIVAPEEILDALKKHLFNDALWPDFSCLPNDLAPTVVFRAIEVGRPFEVAGLAATAVWVSHIVPTCGYILDGGGACVVFSGDTGPTEALWAAVRARGDAKGLFVECSFPNELQHLADASKHLTPRTLRREMEKFPPAVPVYLYHMKPPTLGRLKDEIAALSDARLTVLADGDELAF